MRRDGISVWALLVCASLGGPGCVNDAGSVAAPTFVAQKEGGSGNANAAPSPSSGTTSGGGSSSAISSPYGTGSGLGAASGSLASSGATSPSSGTMSIAYSEASAASAEAGFGDTGALPCAIQELLANRCQSCHGPVPILPAPMSLETVADLMAISLPDPTKTNAEESIVRMQDTVSPMPPAPAAPATVAEIAALQIWISAGYPPSEGCSAPDGGDTEASSDASVDGDAYDGPLVCSSAQTYSGGNGGAMRPGDTCGSCHNFTIAGTVYETEHEPLLCDGVNVSGANVVVTDGRGVITTIPVSPGGNFYSTAPVSAPFQAMLVYQGREREMMQPQAAGNCNLCHTAIGANGAPGRIMLP